MMASRRILSGTQAAREIRNDLTAAAFVNAGGSPPATQRPALSLVIDPARLERAVHLRAVRLGPGRYRVEGGEHPHDVAPRGAGAPDHHLQRQAQSGVGGVA